MKVLTRVAFTGMRYRMPGKTVKLKRGNVYMGKELNRTKGRIGEDRASAFLIDRGFKIIERNYTSKRGEVDIIAMKEGTLHFVEVKARRNAAHGHPLEAIDSKKIRRICAAANHYLTGNGLAGKLPVSIDAVSILGDEISFVESITAFI